METEQHVRSVIDSYYKHGLISEDGSIKALSAPRRISVVESTYLFIAALEHYYKQTRLFYGINSDNHEANNRIEYYKNEIIRLDTNQCINLFDY